jgi:hypothetical protein
LPTLREAEEFPLQFTVLYPNEVMVRNGIRAARGDPAAALRFE